MCRERRHYNVSDYFNCSCTRVPVGLYIYTVRGHSKIQCSTIQCIKRAGSRVSKDTQLPRYYFVYLRAKIRYFISNFKKVEWKVMSLKSKHLYYDANIAIVILFCPFLTVKERNHSLLSQLLPMWNNCNHTLFQVHYSQHQGAQHINLDNPGR